MSGLQLFRPKRSRVGANVSYTMPGTNIERPTMFWGYQLAHIMMAALVSTSSVIIVVVLAATGQFTSDSTPTFVHAYALTTNTADYITGDSFGLVDGVSISAGSLYFSSSAMNAIWLNYALPKTYTACIWTQIDSFASGLDSVWLSSAQGGTAGSFAMGSTLDNQAFHGRSAQCGNAYHQHTAPVSPSGWKHVCFSFDGTDSSIFVGGALDSKIPANDWLIRPEDVVIGKMNCQSGVFRGRMKGLGIWSIPLEAPHVARIFVAQSANNFTLESFL